MIKLPRTLVPTVLSGNAYSNFISRKYSSFFPKLSYAFPRWSVGTRKKVLLLLLLLGNLAYAEEIYATFTVQAQKESKLALEVPGVVSKIHADIGDRVQQGEILLELDSDKEQLDLKLTQSALSIAKLSAQYANNSYERYKKIQNVIDKEQFEKYELDKKLKSESLSESSLRAEQSQVMLNKRKLQAPYAGIITAKNIEVGDGVSGTAQTLFTIIAYPEVKLVLSFDQKYWNQVKVGQTFKYTIDGETTPREAKINKIYPMIDTQNRRLQAEVVTQDITPGLFGDGSIITE